MAPNDWKVIGVLLIAGVLFARFLMTPSGTPEAEEPGCIGVVMLILLILFSLAWLGLRWAVEGR